jgi:hypothetical protein
MVRVLQHAEDSIVDQVQHARRQLRQQPLHGGRWKCGRLVATSERTHSEVEAATT